MPTSLGSVCVCTLCKLSSLLAEFVRECVLCVCACLCSVLVTRLVKGACVCVLK